MSHGGQCLAAFFAKMSGLFWPVLCIACCLGIPMIGANYGLKVFFGRVVGILSCLGSFRFFSPLRFVERHRVREHPAPVRHLPGSGGGPAVAPRLVLLGEPLEVVRVFEELVREFHGTGACREAICMSLSASGCATRVRASDVQV